MSDDEKAGEEALESYMELLGDDTCACCGREDYAAGYICRDCGMCDSCGCECREYEGEFGDYHDDDFENYR